MKLWPHYSCCNFTYIISSAHIYSFVLRLETSGNTLNCILYIEIKKFLITKNNFGYNFVHICKNFLLIIDKRNSNRVSELAETYSISVLAVDF